MAKQQTVSSSSSDIAQSNKNFVSEDDLCNFGWEVIDGDDLYADVESLDSFSISLQSEGGKSQGSGIDLQVIADSLGFYVPQQNLNGSCFVKHNHHHDCECRRGFDHTGDLSSKGDSADGGDVEVLPQMFHHDLVGSLGFRASGPILGVSPIQSQIHGSNGLGDSVHHGEWVDDDFGDSSSPHEGDLMRFGGFLPIFAPAANLDDARHVENHYCRHRGLTNHSRLLNVGVCDGIIDDDEDHDYDHYNDDGGASEVDDELVPWGLTNRLEKQRMRKLGKRTYAKMKNSKKMAHTYTKAACVRGKHGLGLKVY